MNDQRDEYLENEYLVLEMCDLTIQNSNRKEKRNELEQ